MAEPFGLTLAAAAIVEPAIRAACKAYEMVQLNRSFGPDFKAYSRRLDGQKARMEEWSQWPIGSLINAENDKLVQVIVGDLAAIQIELTKCAAIRAKYQLDVRSVPQTEQQRNATKIPVNGLGNRTRRGFELQIKTSMSDPLISPSSTSDTSDETAITSIHDSWNGPTSGRAYSDAIVQSLASQQRQDAARMQKHTGLGKRVKWVFRDREDYMTSIRRITECNDEIERFVRTRALSVCQAAGVGKATTESLVEVTDSKMSRASLPAQDQSCIEILTRLHGALVQHRKSDCVREIAKTRLGLKASLEHSLTRENLLTEFEELPLRANSQVYLLQASELSPAKESTLLVVDSPVEPYTTQSVPQVLEHDIDPFVHLSDVGTQQSDVHRLFKDSTAWASAMSLRDLICSTETPPSPAIRFRLAALLATIHLHSTGVTYAPGQLTLENFKYFDISSEAELTTFKEILEDEDRLLSLYYFFGFGSTRPRSSTRGIGTSKAVPPTFDVAITELGFLLHQISVWRPLDYSNATSNAARDQLREFVKRKLHEMHRAVGARYAETVELCLEWRYKPARDRQAELPLLYDGIVKSLRDLDEEIRFGNFDVELPP